MPRAPAPNARYLAIADSPLLPFLAPRVLSRSPFRSTPAQRLNARTCTHTPKEKETTDAVRNIGCVRNSTEAKGKEQGREPIHACSFPKTGHGGNATSLLQKPSFSSPRRSHAPLASTSNFLGPRYVDIYSFAQKQLAHHSTASRSNVLGPRKPGLRRLGPRIRQVLARQLDPATVRHFLNRPTRKVEHTSRRDPKRLANRRREKMLRVEQMRYENYKSYLPFTDPSKLLSHGRYRSLQRRIYALSRVKNKVLDLTEKQDDFGDSVLLGAFAALDRRAYPGKKRATHLIRIQHGPRVENWALSICQGVGTLGEEKMQVNWMDSPEADRNSSWHLVLIYLLDRRPEYALWFIYVLAQDPGLATLRRTFLADALEHIAKLCARGMQAGRSTAMMAYLVPVFSFVFRKHLATHNAMCTQDLFFSLASIATLHDLKHVFDLIVRTKVFVGYDTLLHYANSFGKFGDHEYALRCLQRITELASSDAAANAMITRRRFTWSCALILRKSMSDRKNFHLSTEIVADFLKLGVKLDILLYNVLMHNAMEAGDDTTAFRIYNLLAENGIQPDRHTYGILLHGCSMTNNPAMFGDFAEHCADKAKELEDAWLATEYLYYLYLRHHKDDPQHLSTVLLHAYSQFFSLDPIQPFLPPVGASNRHILQEADFVPLQPSKVALYIMLQTEIRKALSSGHASNAQVWRLYRYFSHLVEEGNHPLLSELAKEPTVWNAFLYAFCQNQQFASASQLIKNMTDGKPANMPQPNVYSWNIFMQEFFKNEQVRAAERIYEIMQSRGVKPDQFSYGILLRGYAKAQHIDKIGEVMGKLENEKQLDPMLLQALTKVHNRKRLLVALEETRLAKEKADRERMQKEEEERKRRWERPQFRSLLSTPLPTKLPKEDDTGKAES